MARTSTHFQYQIEFPSTMKGHHISARFYRASTADYMECLPDTSDAAQAKDIDAIGILSKNEQIVGHIPKNLTSLLSHFLRHGTITCNPTGERFYRHGLEVPCRYILKGKHYNHIKILKNELNKIKIENVTEISKLKI